MLDGQGKKFIKKISNSLKKKKILQRSTLKFISWTAGSWLFITINGALVYNPKKINSKFTKSVTFRLWDNDAIPWLYHTYRHINFCTILLLLNHSMPWFFIHTYITPQMLYMYLRLWRKTTILAPNFYFSKFEEKKNIYIIKYKLFSSYYIAEVRTLIISCYILWFVKKKHELLHNLHSSIFTCFHGKISNSFEILKKFQFSKCHIMRHLIYVHL